MSPDVPQQPVGAASLPPVLPQPQQATPVQPVMPVAAPAAAVVPLQATAHAQQLTTQYGQDPFRLAAAFDQLKTNYLAQQYHITPDSAGK